MCGVFERGKKGKKIGKLKKGRGIKRGMKNDLIFI